ncbi:transposon Tf2-8 polyprotein [Trichonephila clavipes]|nr:transposon Tf2-8 polyprotein [Trichonephila clavipes]
MSQDRQKKYADKSRRPSPNYKINDLVWVKLHPLSKASQNRSTKLMPRRDGPYIVLSQRSPTTFVVASCDKPDEPLGVYHTSALTPFLNGTETQSPVVPLKKRGRPRKQPLVPNGTAGENAIMSASTPPHRDGLRRWNRKIRVKRFRNNFSGGRCPVRGLIDCAYESRYGNSVLLLFQVIVDMVLLKLEKREGIGRIVSSVDIRF